MRQGQNGLRAVATAILLLLAGTVVAADGERKEDVFKGKLFPPNVILENQSELNLSKEQFTKIRAAVVEVQTSVAEFEWDMREAYLKLMQELDKAPVSESLVLEHATTALQAENEVKKRQMAMLVRLKNLLTEEQIATLQAIERRRANQ